MLSRHHRRVFVVRKKILWVGAGQLMLGRMTCLGVSRPICSRLNEGELRIRPSVDHIWQSYVLNPSYYQVYSCGLHSLPYLGGRFGSETRVADVS